LITSLLRLKVKGLKVSGTKIELIERLLDLEKTIDSPDIESAIIQAKKVGLPRLNTISRVEAGGDEWLLDPLVAFIGDNKNVSSRELGRMLNMAPSDMPGMTANSRMKELYGSMRMYLQSHPDIFQVSEGPSGRSSNMEYFVSVRK